MWSMSTSSLLSAWPWHGFWGGWRKQLPPLAEVCICPALLQNLELCVLPFWRPQILAVYIKPFPNLSSPPLGSHSSRSQCLLRAPARGHVPFKSSPPVPGDSLGSWPRRCHPGRAARLPRPLYSARRGALGWEAGAQAPARGWLLAGLLYRRQTEGKQNHPNAAPCKCSVKGSG